MTQNQIAAIINEWTTMPGRISLADNLRAAAAEIREDYSHAKVTSSEFAAAAAICGFNPTTAARCWSYVG